ncbi:hypothetical protein BKA67DRAFT_301765 [Truncatella angustata]|uniref:Uncharacterized protein n=1 Tax=Truncatella angustata TaxID=152316 RepID=A0A9P8UIH8_9PEZI|nr:uncharacterized protein BKA67DRAFT_301765 [Truncatella angustata]KAH6652812.1 hypothetical protein BKA67DRAFT_301765 [Truncatella angustata]
MKRRASKCSDHFAHLVTTSLKQTARTLTVFFEDQCLGCSCCVHILLFQESTKVHHAVSRLLEYHVHSTISDSGSCLLSYYIHIHAMDMVSLEYLTHRHRSQHKF